MLSNSQLSYANTSTYHCLNHDNHGPKSYVNGEQFQKAMKKCT